MCVHNIYNFYPNRMARSAKKSPRRKMRHSCHRGGGYSDGPGFIRGAPGNLIHNSYSGPQTDFSPLKDCTGNPMSHRTGYIPVGTDMSVRGGLPGLRGGKRGRKHSGKRGRKRGGAAMPYMATLDHFTDRPVYSSVTAPPASFPDRTGAGTPQPPVQQVVAVQPGGAIPTGAVMPPGMSSQVIPPAMQKQSGGRWAGMPGMGPLNPENGVGTTPGPFGRIPCEAGTYNPLNPNPDNIQRLTTAPLTPAYVRMPPMNTMRGGSNANMLGSPVEGGSGYSAANFPVVQVGAADSMRYYAPTAGYGHAFQTFRAPSPVPALMLNTQYDARAFNPACIKTGGSRKKQKKRHSRHSRSKRRSYKGGAPVAFDAGKFAPVTVSQVGSRYDFDGSRNGLPVRFGGSRSGGSRSGGSRRKRHHKRSRRSTRRSTRRHTRHCRK